MIARVLPAKSRVGFARCLFAVLALLGLFYASVGFQALAQSDGGSWTTPVNLSRSGAASSPTIVVASDDTLRVFWWDQFDGLMVTEGMIESWSEPSAAPIFLVERVEGETPEEEELVFTPIDVMPHIVADAAAGAHAFWLGEPLEPDEAEELYGEPGVRLLMYSQLAPGSTSWSWAGVMARSAVGFDVIADTEGVLHLVYVRASHTRSFPAGLYYKRSDDGGTTWSSATTIYQSRYFRLFSAEDVSANAHVRLAADDTGGVYVTWDDPHLKQVLIAYSADRGVTWQVSESVSGPDARSKKGELVAMPGGEVLLLWEEARIGETCGLYQAFASELLIGTVDAGQPLLGDLAACLGRNRLLPFGEGQVLLGEGIGSDELTLAIWNGERWSEPKELRFSFQDPELERQAHLSGLQVALVSSFSDEGDENAAETLVVVGMDQNNEIWITGSQVETLEWVFAQPLPTHTPSPTVEVELKARPLGPVNLSHSRAASNPVIVTGPDGTLRVFWWDQFDGLMAADGAVVVTSVLSGTEEISTTLQVWLEPSPAPIFVAEIAEDATPDGEAQRQEPVLTPIETMPRIVAGVDGQVHAFWLEERREATSDRPLMHSMLDAGSTTWSRASVVAESAVSFDVATDASGALHLAYLRTLHTSDFPAGLYYRRSDDGGLIWSAPTALERSLYFRLLVPESAYVRLAAGDNGNVYVAWDDPRLRWASFARSEDGGATWQVMAPVGDPDGQSQHGRVIAVPGDQILLLWEDARFGGRCNLYQVTESELLAGIAREGRRVLEELTSCPENQRFFPVGSGRALMVSGSGSDALMLAAWDGEQWSEPKRVSFRFENPELGGWVYLSDLQVTLVRDASNEGGWDDQMLIAVGTDGEGDVWVGPSQMSTLGMVFAPPPPWSEPVSFSEGETLPGLPAMAVDPDGRVHVLWSESEVPDGPGTVLVYARWASSTEFITGGERWTRPFEVLHSPEGGAAEPALAVASDRLHAVWSGGQNGEIFYSRAFLRDAYAAGGWSEPQPLPAPVAIGSWPDIIVDASGTLHVVYAVPLNEERGVYYTRSDDSGENWSPMTKVSDAAMAGWAMADYPRLAVDWQGVLHVTWVRAALAGGGLPQGVYYARSSDGGQTWSESLEMVEGPYAWPQMATRGDQIHLLWNEATGVRAWWHRWSADGGETWTRPERVRSLGDVPGPVGLASDGVEMLHLTGLGHDEAGKSALLYLTWGGQRWGETEAFRLELARSEPGVAAALLPALGRLDVAFRGVAIGEVETRFDLWHTSRAVPVAAAIPVSTVVPLSPTATPLPTATPAVTPLPTPDFGSASPPMAGGSIEMSLPLLLGGGLAVLIVVSVFGVRLLWVGRR